MSFLTYNYINKNDREVSKKKSFLFAALIALLLPAVLFVGCKKKVEEKVVVIYTALEEDQTAEYLELAKKEMPDLEIK